MRPIMFGLFVVLAAAQISGCSESPKRQRAQKQETDRQERAQQVQDERRALVAALAAQYHAVVLERSSFTWTADVQDALIPEDGRAVAAIASLGDVERDGKTYVVRLLYGDVMTSIALMLKCDRPAEKSGSRWLTGDMVRRLSGPRYAFVAKIDSVKVHRAAVNTEGGVDVERAGWVAEGKCLALRKVPVEEPSEKTGKPLREEK